MLSPYNFAFLTTNQQIQYLHKSGVYATKRSTDEFTYRLFTLHSYFIETCSQRSNDRLIGLYPLPLDLVAAFYADDVCLEALLR